MLNYLFLDAKIISLTVPYEYQKKVLWFMLMICIYWKPVTKKKMNLNDWYIEGSNTDLSNDWTVLDSQYNCNLLNDVYAVHSFPIQKTDEFYKFLRIRQTGSNVSNNYYFSITSLEFLDQFNKKKTFVICNFQCINLKI